MMRTDKWALSLVWLVVMMTPAGAFNEQEVVAKCTNDAMRFCATEVNDRKSAEHCMRQHKRQLSRDCRRAVSK